MFGDFFFDFRVFIRYSCIYSIFVFTFDFRGIFQYFVDSVCLYWVNFLFRDLIGFFKTICEYPLGIACLDIDHSSIPVGSPGCDELVRIKREHDAH